MRQGARQNARIVNSIHALNRASGTNVQSRCSKKFMRGSSRPERPALRSKNSRRSLSVLRQNLSVRRKYNEYRVDEALKESSFGFSRFDAFLLARNPPLSALLNLQTNKKIAP
jgi:hypothetical protein